ncbi:MAG: hypothetical protein IIY78_04165 [Clostridia bacterium]|nr:hypothetical protein [Clostridia bacterium]
MNNIYEQCCVLLRYSDYEAFGAFVLLAASAVIAFPAAFAALVMFYLARDKKKDEFEQAQYTGEEPEEKYRKFNFFGLILILPLIIWLLYLLKAFL